VVGGGGGGQTQRNTSHHTALVLHIHLATASGGRRMARLHGALHTLHDGSKAVAHWTHACVTT
jgi:hypothetical protein